MARKTRHDYREPGSFERCLEAALEILDADSEDDSDYHRRLARFRAAVLAYRLPLTPPRRRPIPHEQPALPFGRGA